MLEEKLLGHCPACGEPRRTAHRALGRLRLVLCAGCGLVYADPQPRGIVEQRYTQEYDLAEHFGDLAPRKRVLYERRLAWMPRPSGSVPRLCDIGCGDGQFIALVADQGWEPLGVELNPPAAAKARDRGLEVAEGRFEDLDDLPWGTFDAVTSWDSIEHVPDPVVFAERMARLLRPGGTLALTTLNRRAFVARVTGARWSMIVPDHFTYWHERPLIGLLERSGMRIISTHTFGLGRDLVAPLDRVITLARGLRAQPRGESGGGWDSHWSVTRAEDVLNRILDTGDLGVGLAVLATKP